MSAPVLVDQAGRSIPLGRSLGRGGEATVYEIVNDRNLVAKIYHHIPAHPKAEKILRMVELGTERLLKLSAWPIGVLHSKGRGDVAGILMQNIGSFKDVHILYNPKSRIREFPPKVNWPFLIHTAGNIARAFSVIHEHGHVIGDVNESNIRVSPDSAVVSLIDCDSFQVNWKGRLFLCEVGVPLYTPPELQEKDFTKIVRTPNHDNFGLAVLIFHLLFMGRHPFAGKFLGRGDMPIEKAIYEFRFAYDTEIHRTQMQPPPNCITLAHVSPQIAELLCKAFSPRGVQNGRPNASQWVEALSSLESRLKKCDVNPGHYYYNSLAECPWCSIEGRAGVLFFIGYAVSDAPKGLKLELVWAQILSVQQPGPATLQGFQHLAASIKPTAQARGAALKRRIRFVGAVVIVIATVAAGLASGLGAGAIWLGVVSAFIANGMVKGSREAKRRFNMDLQSAEARLRSVQGQWDRDCSDTRFTQKLAQVSEARNQYAELPMERQRKLRGLDQDRYRSQLCHFLDRFQVSTADIPHIGNTRKAMLLSYGIDSAADVSAAAIDLVPGFGHFLTTQMIAWRQSVEKKFRFDSSRGIDQEDVRALDREITLKRVELEKVLLQAPSQLLAIRNEILMNRKRLYGEMEQAWSGVFQARANADAA